MLSRKDKAKRVRFSGDSSPGSSRSTSAVESSPSTPSLTFSSCPSSPNESLLMPTLEINSLLVLSSVPGIIFDASRPPLESFACNGFVLPSVMTRDLLLSQPVTSPPTQSLILVSDLLPWYTKVEPAANNLTRYQKNLYTSARQFVTMADLLSCIFNALQRFVTPAEFASFSQTFKAQVTAQFYRRLDRVMDPQEMIKVKNRGVKRLDVLLGRTTFMGLKVRDDSSGEGPPSLLLYFK